MYKCAVSASCFHTHLHDLYKLHAGISRILKLLGLYPRWSKVVATQLCVHIDPGIDSDGVVVQPPAKNLKEVVRIKTRVSHQNPKPNHTHYHSAHQVPCLTAA